MKAPCGERYRPNPNAARASGGQAARTRRAKPLVATLGLWLWVVPAQAGSFEDGMAAAQRGDYVTAATLWRPLAENGDARGQGALGLLYDSGQGVKQDDAQAIKWYRAAAEQGLAQAQYSLGVMYDDGRGTAQDDAEAVKWYRRAADQRVAQAQYSLGLMYAKGEGTAQDNVRAHMWWTLALANINDEQARKTIANSLALVTSKMTPEQVAEAEKLAKAWSPTSAGE